MNSMHVLQQFCFALLSIFPDNPIYPDDFFFLQAVYWTTKARGMSDEQLVRVYASSNAAEIVSMKAVEGERVHKGSVLFCCKSKSNAVDTIIKSPVVGVVKKVLGKEGTLVTKK